MGEGSRIQNYCFISCRRLHIAALAFTDFCWCSNLLLSLNHRQTWQRHAWKWNLGFRGAWRSTVPPAVTSRWRPPLERWCLSKEGGAKKPVGYLAMATWAHRNAAFSSTQLIPSGETSLWKERHLRGRWGSTWAKSQTSALTLSPYAHIPAYLATFSFFLLLHLAFTISLYILPDS